MGLYLGSQRVCPIVRSNGKDSGGQFLVTIIDYDGTILFQDHLNNGTKIYRPQAPNHDNLTFQGWSCAEPVSYDGSNYYYTVNGADMTIGAFYTTKSGKTEIDIKVTPTTGLTFSCKFIGTKDWGDGTSDSSSTHTYSTYGNYTVSVSATSYGSISSSSGIFGQGSSSPDYFAQEVRLGSGITSLNNSYVFQYCYGLRAFSIHTMTSTVFGTSYLRYCRNLKALVIPNGIISLGQYAVYNNSAMEWIAIPSTVTTFNSYAVSNNTALKSLTVPNTTSSAAGGAFQSNPQARTFRIPSSLTTLTTNILASRTNLVYLKIPKTITSSIPTKAFQSNTGTLYYDFSEFTSVPTLDNVDAFSGIAPFCEIRVPTSLLATWKAASNWVTYANYIVGV